MLKTLMAVGLYMSNNYIFDQDSGLPWMFKNKMVTLIKSAEVLSDRFSETEEDLQRKVQILRDENSHLRHTWQTLWNEGGTFHE